MLESLERKFAKFQFGSKQRLRIYRKISTMTRYGIPMQRVLEMLYDQASKGGKRKNDPIAVVLTSWRTAIRNGRPLSVAAAPWVPYIEQMMIEAGEESQNLSDSLENLIMINQGISKMKATVVGGLSYPAALFIAVCGVLWLFGVKVIPAFADVLPVDKWTGIAASMNMMSNFVQDWLLITLFLFVCLIVLISWSMPRWTGPIRKVLDYAPPWSLYRLVSGAGFLLSMGALVGAGVQTARSLEKLKKQASPWLKERLEATLRHVYSGSNLGRALQRAGHGYPDYEIIDDLVAYSDLPAFTEMLNTIGREWLSDSVGKLQAQARILNIVAMLFLAGIVGWMFSGMFAIQQQITASTGL